MPPAAKSFLRNWALISIGVLAASSIVPGIEAATPLALLGASLLLGILNAFLRPILLLLSLPLLLVTLGLFTLVINAVLLYFVGSVVRGFEVQSFWAALFGAIVISIISIIGNLVLGPDSSRSRHASQGRAPRQGNGPVIDV